MSEYQEQSELFRWAGYCKYNRIFKHLLFSIPNESGGGTRGDMLRGKKKKREGRKAGISDILFACPKLIKNPADGWTNFCHGLFIEMKDHKKYLDPKQKLFLNAVRSQGYFCWGVQGWERGSQLLTTYIEAPERLLPYCPDLYFKGVR